MSPEQHDSNHFLSVPSTPEDWGGDGRGRMNLSGRCSAIAPTHQPRQYQFFDSNTVPEEESWRIPGMPTHVLSIRRRLLTWHESGAETARLFLPPGFQTPPGLFTADLEIFVIRGTIKFGEWQLRKHGYSFIPAGVNAGELTVLGDETAELLWMANGPVPLRYEATQENHPEARLREFIPALDTQRLPWGKTDTVQFEQAKKKYLRKDNLGGGVWLLAILPHYDGLDPQVQCYNEEAYCLAGAIDIGGYRFTPDHAAYCPTFNTSPRHQTDEGTMFFVRVDRDLSQVGTVLSYPF